MTLQDRHGRVLRDLRISVTDRCNFRCGYCMPADQFGPGHEFLPKGELLTFEEIHRVAGLAVAAGVTKLRLTGGEPLLRHGIENLVGLLASLPGKPDLALTTNGILLAHQAERLALAGLNRVTVSLDAIDPEIFGRMNGTGADVSRVLSGIEVAKVFGLPVKVNAVIQRGVNETQVLPLVRWARESGVTMRFIEFMDVGETNGWDRRSVVPAAEMVEMIVEEFPLEVYPGRGGATALRYRHTDGRGEIGIIASVTRPFCGDCSRLRLSPEGKLFTCLFAGSGHDLKGLLRGGADDSTIAAALGGIWGNRDDRYSELRDDRSEPVHKAEMSYLGG
ncbi:GTP 3',8-cyclase MoaA [Luteolibacter ambystomatis]|uniref:GTP 3',8-cyclase n=1 Tax=Luteolibacter ambystomatis TaxID=2824561 RepID=A0A975PEQ8_9BACT|nr:GTP 3',8-cyclase MoaA [Luteolibacter ambystomatis]QUE51594.1 GTP 3',8-cyclase MoaA [Luteolibacter ambystomatis]